MSEALVQTKMKKMKIFFEGNKKARRNGELKH